MPKHWVKEEVHRNEVALVVERALNWAAAHREIALGAGATVLAAGALSAYTAVRYQDLKRAAWEKLAVAQSYAFAGQGKAALEQLKSVSELYPRTRAAGFGELFQGDVLYQSGDYKGAAASYLRCRERQDPTLTPFALSGLAFAQEGDGQYAAALESGQRFLAANQDHFLAPEVHAVVARSLKALARDEESKATLEKISLLYPETFWAQWAQETLHPQPKVAPAPAPARP